MLLFNCFLFKFQLLRIKKKQHLFFSNHQQYTSSFGVSMSESNLKGLSLSRLTIFYWHLTNLKGEIHCRRGRIQNSPTDSSLDCPKCKAAAEQDMFRVENRSKLQLEKKISHLSLLLCFYRKYCCLDVHRLHIESLKVY